MSAYDTKSNMGEEKDEMLEHGSALSEEETSEEPPRKDQDDSKDGRRKSRNLITIDVTEIIEGKREKKTVQRLDFQIAKPKEKLKIENGGGDKLGDIARSNHHIGRMKAPDLKPLHKVLFDRPGAVATMRKNMRLFNGFLFEVDSDLYIKKQKMLLKLTNTKLRTICKVLDLERGGIQSVLVERILTFLMSPKITGKPVVSKKKKKSKKRISTKDPKGKTKAKAKSASSSPRKTKAESKSKAIVTDSSSEDDEDEEEDKPGVEMELEGSEAEKKGGKAAKEKDETSEEESDDSDEEDEEEEEGPKSKPAARGKATAKKSTPVKQRPIRKTAPLKRMREESSESDSDSDKSDKDEKDSESEVQKPKRKQAAKRVAPTKSAAKTKKADSSSNRRKKTSEKVEGTEGDDSSDDDEPLIKMIKKPPSNEQLKETLKSMLKDANLEEMTMKHICQKVYDTYPDYDLTSRKSFIKETVKMLIS